MWNDEGRTDSAGKMGREDSWMGQDASGEEPEWDPDEVVALPLEDVLDLHSFLPRDIPLVVEEYIVQCLRAGFREVRLIHGKGTGFQRERVRQVLTGLPGVCSFWDAPPERGSWGATVVALEPPSGRCRNGNDPEG